MRAILSVVPEVPAVYEGWCAVLLQSCLEKVAHFRAAGWRDGRIAFFGRDTRQAGDVKMRWARHNGWRYRGTDWSCATVLVAWKEEEEIDISDVTRVIYRIQMLHTRSVQHKTCRRVNVITCCTSRGFRYHIARIHHVVG